MDTSKYIFYFKLSTFAISVAKNTNETSDSNHGALTIMPIGDVLSIEAILMNRIRIRSHAHKLLLPFVFVSIKIAPIDSVYASDVF